ncbi:MAG: hypothetical protein R3F56_06240 [Planctomycetota bacterium]
MHGLLVIAGVVQLGIVLASMLVPAVLGWREETRRLEPLTRVVFWTYAGYIVATNLALAIASLLLPDSLLASGPLPRAVSGYGALYWGARVTLQFVAYRRYAPQGPFYRLADIAFSAAFAFVALVFAAAAAGLG